MKKKSTIYLCLILHFTSNCDNESSNNNKKIASSNIHAKVFNEEILNLLPDTDQYKKPDNLHTPDIEHYLSFSKAITTLFDSETEITEEKATEMLNSLHMSEYDKKNYDILHDAIKSNKEFIMLHDLFPFLFHEYKEKLEEFRKQCDEEGHEIAIDLGLQLIKNCMFIHKQIKREEIKSILDNFLTIIAIETLHVDEKNIFLRQGPIVIFEKILNVTINITHKQYRQQLYDIIEYALLQYIKENANLIFAYRIIKKHLINAYELKHEIIPSFIYLGLLCSSNADLLTGISQEIIDYIVYMTEKKYLKIRSRALYQERTIEEQEDDDNTFYVSYACPAKKTIVATLMSSGWNRESFSQCLTNQNIFSKNNFKKNIIFVLPYFNAYHKKLDKKMIFSDIITLSLLYRSMMNSPEDNYSILPLYTPVNNTPQNTGIGSVCVMIGDVHSRAGIMYGAPDLFYQPLPFSPRANQGHFIHEKWYRKVSDITPYSTPIIYNNNLLNQTIEGEIESFWQILTHPLFLKGKIDETPAAYFRIEVNNATKEKELIIPVQKIQMITTPDNYEYKYIITTRLDALSTSQSQWISPHIGTTWNVLLVNDKETINIT
jgi:hypothetical protein